jgi:hypothetical protein
MIEFQKYLQQYKTAARLTSNLLMNFNSFNILTNIVTVNKKV